MSLKDVLENKTVTPETENLQPLAQFIEWMDNASKEELVEARKACQSYKADFSTRMGTRRLAGNMATVISKEIKQFD